MGRTEYRVYSSKIDCKEKSNAFWGGESLLGEEEMGGRSKIEIYFQRFILLQNRIGGLC